MTSVNNTTSTIAIIPGTGNIGFALSRRFVKAGHRVLLGSRDAGKAKGVADKIINEFPNAKVEPFKNEDIPISEADVVVWCPQASIQDGMDYLKHFDFSGKIVLDTTNIVYKVKDVQSFIGQDSSTERVSLSLSY